MSNDELPVSQAAWNDFADQLKRIGEKITGPTGARNGRERAEGYRYLVRLISAAHQLEMEIDRRHPSLARMMTPIRKFKGDGTDTLYHEAKLDEDLSYVFSVRRGEDIFFSATVYAHDERDAYYIVDDLVDDKIEWQDDGGEPMARIHLSAERPEGAKNWIQLKSKGPILFTRQYFPEFVDSTDVGRYRPAIFDIECLSEVAAPEALGEEDLADGLERVIEFIDDATNVSIGLSIFAGLNLVSYEKTQQGQQVDATHITEGKMHLDDDRHDEYTPEQLAAMVDPKLISNNLPGPGIQYLGAWYKLEGDEAIKIEGRDVPCRYWSCQILTRYLESGDFRHHRVGINNRQVKLAEDGSFVIYASHENPGVDNWISTQGYTNGHILIRTLLADPLMQASFSVVKLAEIG
ncbi:MAG: DUF1214 domain-containing protein [Deltaproteobacteria bacterium]|nr:DUF1214 domain-containing protein [Deltaproteobacteria bacterium]